MYRVLAIQRFTTDLPQVTICRFMRNGEPSFVAKDATKAVGDVNGPNAVANHVDDDQRGGIKRMIPGGNQQLTIINEGSLYALIVGSNLPQARAFRRWALDTVLLSLRKHGD